MLRCDPNAFGDLEYALDANQNRTSFGWCDCEGLDWIADPLLNTNRFVRDFNGRVTKILFNEGAHGYIERNLHSTGVPSSVSDSAGLTVTYEYNNQGLPTRAYTSQGDLYRIIYDAYDRVTSYVNADGVGVATEYDGLGRPRFRTFERGQEQFIYSTNGLKR